MAQELLLFRLFLFLLLGSAAVLLRPAQWTPLSAAALGLSLAAVAVLAEMRLRRAALPRLVGGAIGGLCGLLAALLISLVLTHALPDQGGVLPVLQVCTLAGLAYLGMILGGVKLVRLPFSSGPVSEAPSSSGSKLLDTSVIIDGRVADIAATGFLEGTLLIPQFVLRELQLVADSSDTMKRNRGRRGLDVLQRIQNLPTLKVKIVEQDFPNIREVDMKLLELARQLSCSIVTNDFNLNKIAQLHHVEVLNINDLANALKPVVLPGEIMRVFILKEGKEHNQGVAYLDDGTMVVVDNARRLISKTIDISVTSVLQTTAGKMIFGKYDDRVHPIHSRPDGNDRPSRESAAN